MSSQYNWVTITSGQEETTVAGRTVRIARKFNPELGKIAYSVFVDNMVTPADVRTSRSDAMTTGIKLALGKAKPRSDPGYGVTRTPDTAIAQALKTAVDKKVETAVERVKENPISASAASSMKLDQILAQGGQPAGRKDDELGGFVVPYGWNATRVDGILLYEKIEEPGVIYVSSQSSNKATNGRAKWHVLLELRKYGLGPPTTWINSRMVLYKLDDLLNFDNEYWMGKIHDERQARRAAGGPRDQPEAQSPPVVQSDDRGGYVHLTEPEQPAADTAVLERPAHDPEGDRSIMADDGGRDLGVADPAQLAAERQEGIRPDYYRGASGQDAIDVIEDFNMTYHVGTAFAYMVRYERKGNDPVEDIEKAITHLRREQDRLRRKGR